MFRGLLGNNLLIMYLHPFGFLFYDGYFVRNNRFFCSPVSALKDNDFSK